MAHHREYRSAGCQPLSIAGWITAIACLFMAERTGPGQPGWWLGALWLLSAAAAAGLALHLRRNRAAGCWLDGEVWLIYYGRQRWSVPLSRIARIHLGPPCQIALADGPTITLPAECLPPAKTLAAWLAATAIPCETGAAGQTELPQSDASDAAAPPRLATDP